MGLENMNIEELVAIDKTYLERIRHRREIMTGQPAATLACNESSIQAVLELHGWMFQTYLPQRFPAMFDRHKPARTKNLVTGEEIMSEESDAITALRNLGSHVDTDFLFLLPSSTTEDGLPIYHLEAFVTCFPSGFSTRSKLGKPLAEIHKPVPGYAVKLERSMDRYFAKITDKVVKRANWTITTTDDLFIEAGTHLYGGDRNHESIGRQTEEIVIEDCRLRAERQTLHRLPKSKALVFAFKTYQYHLDDVKAEGDGPALASAIEGLAAGSVPEMHFYKRGVVWGAKVARYLRE
ncbi:hypothetical protein AMS68_000545 [Peltaster fructicola]|uniref:DUF3445 domain-containing protein n=1 Tax=Peltaster fructicola TaxID=286661 RepID=A0A6H0XK69_9PEZI|nr:hypothetical protein AMS68_000545 [Peltaster fructicola]